MPLIFSYGSLQLDYVQVATFGRTLKGVPDALPRFRRSEVPIEDAEVGAFLDKTHHANAVPSSRADDSISGTVFEITSEELTQADEYERRDSYARVQVRLASGIEAWVYMHSPASQAG